MTVTRLSRAVAKSLGHYVYLYVNPETGEPFYVGKGKGGRVLSHMSGSQNPKVAKEIKKLKSKGFSPRVEILVHGLPDEATAHVVEAAVIDAIGIQTLANEVHGHHAKLRGRMSLEQVVSLYQGKRASITEPSILIRINQLYQYGMSDVELYDATRGVWVTGKRREATRLAFAVYQGIVREVYQIKQWLPAGSTFSTRNPSGVRRPGRWEFVGTLAPEKIRTKYLNRSVEAYLSKNSQNPITYVNCPEA